MIRIDDKIKRRILALDVGTVRVGLAACKHNSNIVTSIGILNRAKGEAEKAILEMILKWEIEVLLVGLPLDAENRETEQCQKVRSFIRRLSRRLEEGQKNLSIVYIDEYASSLEADELLKGKSRGGNCKGKNSNDDYAACLILERYLKDTLER